MLIYQQNGRHFDAEHTECKIVIILLAIFVALVPVVMFFSVRSCLKWRMLLNAMSIDDNIKWQEVRTLDADSNIDLKHLIAVKQEVVTPAAEEEKTEEDNDVDQKADSNENNFNLDIVLTAHKSKWKLHTLSFIAQLILFGSVQYKNYNEEKEKLYEWGYRFSRLIDLDDYYIAKWELENGIKPDPNETFESLEWLEHIARMNIQNN